MKRNCSEIQFLKTERRIKNEKKKNREWISITLKTVTKRCFLKTATLKFWKCKEK